MNYEKDYFSNRIHRLEQRKIEHQGRITIHENSIKSINKRIEECKNAMESNSYSSEEFQKNQLISDLKKKVDSNQNIIKKLKKDNSQLKSKINNQNKKISSLKEEINELKSELALKRLDTNSSRDDVILSDNFGESNIFEKVRE